jgi:hypothetical protein
MAEMQRELVGGRSAVVVFVVVVVVVAAAAARFGVAEVPKSPCSGL